MSALITSRLLGAMRETRPAREALRAVEWAALPELFVALGAQQSPEVCELLTACDPGDAQSLIGVRAALACIGERYRQGGYQHRALRAMCSELVGLCGAALSLYDAGGAL